MYTEKKHADCPWCGTAVGLQLCDDGDEVMWIECFCGARGPWVDFAKTGDSPDYDFVWECWDKRDNS